jgi:hypothetical protein
MIPVLIWIMLGLYGLFYNPTYVDEAKYLIKGWLMATGQVGYYSTPEFFYQHLPGGLLWYGWGQKLFGPSLLTARIQSFAIGLLILFFAAKLAKAINPQAKNRILPLLSLAPAAILYYSSAVPQSLAALGLTLAFYSLFKNKTYLATLFFTLTFIVRENFLFTLLFYFAYLIFYQKKLWLKQLAVSLMVIGGFFLPNWQGMLRILKNFPGVSFLLPVEATEKAVLGLNWMVKNYPLNLYLRAVLEFGVVYGGFWLAGLMAIVPKTARAKLGAPDPRWRLLLAVVGLNLVAHTWSAFHLTPRAIIPYFAYIFPLAAVIIAVIFTGKKLKFYWLYLILALTSLNFSAIFQKPNQLNTISVLNQSAQTLKPIIQNRQKIIWLAEPMSLYLAGKVSYYPLINHTNFYKPSEDTATVRRLGYWNEAMLNQWLAEADLLAVDPNRLKIANIKLELSGWEKLPVSGFIWPGNLEFYFNKATAR